MDPLETVSLDGLDRHIYISTLLSKEEKAQLFQVIQCNIDVFAWTHADMLGINPVHASHKLNVTPSTKPVRQKVRRFHPDRHLVIQTEVDNLLHNEFIRTVKYSEWLANVVVVPKKGNKWRVCVDYTDLNNACLEDSFPLPRIDQIVDASTGHDMLSFLDAFSGYHQIPMHPPDAEKTSFITPHGLYYYNVMPFRLKNAGATYQRLVTKMFRPMLDKTMEVYIDDMLVKSKQRSDHVTHLQQAFDLLQEYGMKLNPLKCAFGVSAEKFLGFMVTQRGIEANPLQLKAILQSSAPTSKKEIQQLTGRLAALGCFISRFTDRLKPFFNTLRGANWAEWGEEFDRALVAIKQYLTEPPVLVSPEHGDTLYLYLTASEIAVSAALFKECEDAKLRPVFFVSKSLTDAETRYTHLEQAALALRTAAQKLRPYFQAHPVVVLTDLPLQGTIHKPDLSGRMARWAMEFSEYGIQYKPRLSKKGQVLANFLVELPQHNICPNNEGFWNLCVDGASRQSGAGIGIQLTSPTGEKIEQAVRLGFNTSNNESEYEALIAGVELALAVGADNLLIRSDSQLVVGQVNTEFESREPRMAKYASLAKQKLSTLSTWRLEHVPRDRNERVDALATIAASLPLREAIYLPIYYKLESSILHTQVSQIQEAFPSWMDPIRLYIVTGELPDDRNITHKIQIQSTRFSIIDGQLYKQSLDGPYLKCLTPEEGQYVFAELHEGICRNHPGGRTLAHRAHTQGYY